MNIKEALQNKILYLDGGMGTLLQKKGLLPGEAPESWSIKHPEIITEIHKSYFHAGSNVICTNTFGVNLIQYDRETLKHLICAAVSCAKRARDSFVDQKERYIALDIGPCGKLLKPFGDLDFEDAVSAFKASVEIGAAEGVDLIFIETMNDSLETKAALLAAKEGCDLPVFVSNAYGEDGKLMTGATPEAMVAMLEGMGADAIGANCSLGPKQLAGVAKSLLKNASVPVILKPNAGLPRMIGEKTVFHVSPAEFASDLAEIVACGVSVVGGCCGTTPEYIAKLCEMTEGLHTCPRPKNDQTVVSSYCKTVTFGTDPILIGERINPTGKKRFKEALIAHDIDYILSEGVKQKEKGVHVLDVNVGLPEIDEVSTLRDAVCALQSIQDLPLQIDSSSPEAMEAALRIYNGKALINSVNGKVESMERIFPLVKKYGGVCIALTLDENGIPETAEGRFEIAKRILSAAEQYGIEKKDLIFDTLALTVSADPKAGIETIKALRFIREKLGCHTSLGISNVSFGLPSRDAVNSTYFALALENGLSAAIMNPYSPEMMRTYYAYRALKNLDENCTEYIAHAGEFNLQAVACDAQTDTPVSTSHLQDAIEKGFCDKAAEITKGLLVDRAPLSLVNEEIIPALNRVGLGFEEKRIYLPQLLMSAEAAGSAFEVIRSAAIAPNEKDKKCKFVLATVRGDIHDIGKNIVKLLMENYGYDVLDLGKDVPAETIVEAVCNTRAPLVGLSALMTTTVPAMEETIRLLRKKAPWCKVVVGGAVLTADYAKKMGADAYAKDAMATVRFAESIEKNLDTTLPS